MIYYTVCTFQNWAAFFWIEAAVACIAKKNNKKKNTNLQLIGTGITMHSNFFQSSNQVGILYFPIKKYDRLQLILL